MNLNLNPGTFHNPSFTCNLTTSLRCFLFHISLFLVSSPLQMRRSPELVSVGYFCFRSVLGGEQTEGLEFDVYAVRSEVLQGSGRVRLTEKWSWRTKAITYLRTYLFLGCKCKCAFVICYSLEICWSWFLSIYHFANLYSERCLIYISSLYNLVLQAESYVLWVLASYFTDLSPFFCCFGPWWPLWAVRRRWFTDWLFMLWRFEIRACRACSGQISVSVSPLTSRPRMNVRNAKYDGSDEIHRWPGHSRFSPLVVWYQAAFTWLQNPRSQGVC